MDFACNNPIAVYDTSAGSSPESVNITITDNCSGSAQVYVGTPKQGSHRPGSRQASEDVISFSIAPVNEDHSSGYGDRLIVSSTFHFAEQKTGF
jgi:hypothetical protein